MFFKKIIFDGGGFDVDFNYLLIKKWHIKDKNTYKCIYLFNYYINRVRGFKL